LPEAAPPELRDRVLHELAIGPGLTFDQSEALELAWGAARRASAERETALAPGAPAFPDELRDPIAASFLSFPSDVVEPSEAAALLAALRRAAPERELVVLADLPMRRRIEQGAVARVHWLDTHGRPYSAWPRDPFSTARLPGGGLVLVERPAFQGGREGDRWMAREIVQNLPEALDRAWGGDGGVRWGAAPFFFHNGHVLMAGGAAWTSLHGLERRILEVLGLERVPVETFGTAAGIDRYLAAARRVIGETSAFYGKPVRLVHPLPDSGPVAERARTMRAIGGGGGFDLDSIVTLLPGPEGGLQALVGDLGLGRALLAELAPGDRAALRRTYGFAPPEPELPALLAAAQGSPRAAGLDAFLELAAAHLGASGVPVRRLPLLLAPTALVEERALYEHPDFLIGWQNTVLDRRGTSVRAEGFASGIGAGDERARAAYREAGVELLLHPPLVRSVIANGGYRCASNQVRTGRPAPPREATSSPLEIP
ncbi:MAG TPA: hypothetical protein VM599_10075, partial [Thermoanaerobaculia bacterium]|nr:hypothetical protein [Thermoanaerobaculia bacterium]